MTGLGVDRIKALTQAQGNLVAAGHCPFCERRIAGWKPVFGVMAPEWWETVRNHGIDPGSGHLTSCPEQQIRMGDCG